ncbi:MlaD family protein [Corynebacterium hansenii]|uniref:MlaD family protein n=1 Tax=Corynebacterium hansenii TaxID=394964 RepID=A0ABV7ZNW6_9CORY|nr:MlaD family protein [Corynebacterium hansenii]WJZ00427.1 mce related protein [Corynebacterium hansenii]
MKSSIKNIVLGAGLFALVAVVIIGLIAVVGGNSREVTAKFSSTSGLFEGSPVRIMGVEVGTVTEIKPVGDQAEVVMSLDDDIQLPADVGAYVMTPSVVAERFVELSPAYQGGQELGADEAIPLERTHAPLDFGKMIDSIDVITQGLSQAGSEEGGAALNDLAGGMSANSEEMARSLDAMMRATSVVGARSEDIGTLLENLQLIMEAAGANNGELTQLLRDSNSVAKAIQASETDIGTSMADLKTLLEESSKIASEHGEDVAATVDASAALGGALADQKVNLAELIDTLPLGMQNITRSRSEDGRIRIRLNVSTALEQFPAFKEVCAQHPLPMCLAPGVTNPIPVPFADPRTPNIIDGLNSAAAGGGR